MKYFDFKTMIHTLAEEYDAEQYADIHQYAHECADSSEHVIYYSKAFDLVNMIRLSDYQVLDHAEEELEAIDYQFESLNSLMTALAYQIIYNELTAELHDMEAAA